MPETVFAYLVIRCSEERDAFMGGIMATDGRGLPLEFSYTSPPIEPTRLQRILFGASLDGYIRREVIGASLLKNLKQTPSLILTGDEAILDLDDEVNCPVVWVQQTNSDPLGVPGVEQTINPTQHLLQLSERGKPVRVACANDAADLWDAVKSILIEGAADTDMMDPIERVREAIDLIWESGDKGEGESG